ncbi:RNA-directed DNA polymerase from mobile element jockey [Elysia marginata]|uniref:RNA-directed DNA polymerase from mobile element jockey n=1 Tax=Elysia marginata TaxID=1093978 RepID=A0AAV4HKF3_9GAST|nr:RNA-directed DNA polymerase from mobile element jockey [Elysia marginata]
MFKRMKNILTNPHMSIETRKRVLECYIEPMLMYGCETWIISKQTRGRLEAKEMWFLRRMTRIPRIARKKKTNQKTNDAVLSETNIKRALINKIRKRQVTFFGHIMRRERQEHLVTTGMFMGRHGRGRLREKATDRLASWLGVGSTVETIKTTRERGVWRGMIANVMRHGTG